MDPSRAPAPDLRLVIRSGAGAGASYPLRAGLKIGRHPLNEICLRDPGIRSQHAELQNGPHGWVLVDTSGQGLDKSGATWIPLEPGVPARLGPVELVLGDAALAAPRRPAIRTRTITTALPSLSAEGSGFQAPTHLSPPQLEAVLSVQASLVEETSLGGLVKRLVEWVNEVVPSHYCAVLTDDGAGRMVPVASRSQSGQGAVSSSIVDRAVADHVGVLIMDAPEDERIEKGRSIITQNIRSALCVPLVVHGRVIGALYAATRGVSAAFAQEHLHMLSLVAGPAAGALHTAQLIEQLGDTNRDLLRRLSVCARFNDDDTGYHIQRVGDYAAALAAARGCTSTYCSLLRAAAPMHDIGKIGIPQSILQKPGKLTADEFEAMKRHTLIGEEILGGSRAPLIQLAAELAGSHHEKWDGSGYPRGLAGDAIPLSGRLVAVADVFDALTTKRCYKDAFPLDKAYAILREGRGAHFDPTVIDLFFGIVDQILSIRDKYARLEQAKQNDAA